MACLLVAILATLIGADQPARHWKHSGGVFGIEASFVELRGDTLVLRRPDGQLASAPLAEFSQSDQALARQLATQGGEAPRASLGAKFVNTVDIVAAARNSATLKPFADPPVRIGAMIVRVLPNGSAEAAKLQVGDIIYRVDRQPVQDLNGLKETLATHHVHDEILLRIVRPSVRNKRTNWRELEDRITLLPEPDVTDSPLEFGGVIGSSVLNDPKLHISIKNVGQQTVVAYEFKLASYNRFDEPVADSLTGNKGTRLLGQQTIEVGETINVTHTFYWAETTAKVKLILTRVKMVDGFVWQAAEGEQVSVWAESQE